MERGKPFRALQRGSTWTWENTGEWRKFLKEKMIPGSSPEKRAETKDAIGDRNVRKQIVRKHLKADL